LAAVSSADLRSATAAVTAVLKRLRAWPIAGLSAAGTSLSPCISAGSNPLRPMYFTRSASSAAKSAAPASSASACAVDPSTSLMSMSAPRKIAFFHAVENSFPHCGKIPEHFSTPWKNRKHEKRRRGASISPGHRPGLQ